MIVIVIVIIEIFFWGVGKDGCNYYTIDYLLYYYTMMYKYVHSDLLFTLSIRVVLVSKVKLVTEPSSFAFFFFSEEANMFVPCT